MLDFDASSKLSPYLANGSLSVRHCYEALRRREAEKATESTYWPRGSFKRFVFFFVFIKGFDI